MPAQPLSRRHFLQLGGGAVAVLGLGGYLLARDDGGGSGSGPASAGAFDPASSKRRLVIVQLNGGNDCLNTVVPLDGRYRDLRPTLGVPEAGLVTVPGADGFAFHPALAGLVPLWADGRLAIVQGVGFEKPDRSHFVSMDRWWRADDLAAPGWLGRVLDSLSEDPAPLFATALGGGAPLLSGDIRQPTVVGSPGSFRFVGVDPAAIKAMATPASADPLRALAQHSYARAVDAVAEFTAITAGADDGTGIPTREGGATIAGGLATAAALLAADAGTRIVVVSASGFDTHANQAPAHADLLEDLVSGVTTFVAAMESAGLMEDVLLVTTSEFGRRAAENGSGGSDHGAGGTSFVVGAGIEGGAHGEIDLGDLLDGDVRPVIDPRVLYTACLDWLGADADAVLGGRFDSVKLLA